MSGRNSEYILKLSEFMRHEFPSVQEEHLYKIEHWVKVFDAQKLQNSNCAVKNAKCSATRKCPLQSQSSLVSSKFKVDSRSASPTQSESEDVYGEDFSSEGAKHFGMDESESNMKTVSVRV